MGVFMKMRAQGWERERNQSDSRDMGEPSNGCPLVELRCPVVYTLESPRSFSKFQEPKPFPSPITQSFWGHAWTARLLKVPQLIPMGR